MKSINLVLCAGISLGSSAALATASPPDVVLKNTLPLESVAIDQHGVPFTVAGLSGITWLEGQTWVAVMDATGHVVFIDVQTDADGTLLSACITAGLALDSGLDDEGIAHVPLAGDMAFISNEAGPGVREIDLVTGATISTLTIPPVFDSVRGNRGFESLTTNAIGTTLWTANEEALLVDGGVATPAVGTTVRLLQFDTAASPISGAQYAYDVESMHGGYFPVTDDGQSGLSDLVTLPDGTLLALERALAFTAPFLLTRLYHVDPCGADDVSGLPALDGAVYTSVGKTLVFSGGLDNLEGVGLGPELPGAGDGSRLMLGVVDDGDPLSTNEIVAFVVSNLAGCVEDFDADGQVGINDLLSVIAAWGPCACDADIDCSGGADVIDLLAVIAAWGDC